jgi:thiol-disulfide isomerase/thioredoxin
MSNSGFAKSSDAEQQLLPPVRSSWRVWPWVLLAAVVAIVLLVRAGIQSPPPESRGERHPAVGTKLTTFHLEPLTGDSRQVSEADLEGKVTLVNFWGPWCGACLVEFPHLMELEQHFRGQAGFQFFSVSSNYDPRDETGLVESTEQFLKSQRAEFSAYRDPKGQTIIALINSAKVEDFGYPATILVGSDTTIRGLWIGYVPDDEKAVRQAIEDALRKRL